jgi:hypothetical protein
MMRNLILAGLIWSLGDGKALADDTPSTPADQPIVTTEESTSVVAPLTLSPPLNPDCPDQPDIPGLQAEYNAYNNATYASALEAKGLVPTTLELAYLRSECEGANAVEGNGSERRPGADRRGHAV